MKTKLDLRMMQFYGKNISLNMIGIILNQIFQGELCDS